MITYISEDKKISVEDFLNFSRVVAQNPEGIERLATKDATATEVVDSMEEVIKDFIVDMSYADGELSINKFNQHKHEFFQIIEQVLSPIVNEQVYDMLENIAEVKSAAYDDENVFTNPNQGLFKTTLVSDGNWNIARQKADKATYALEMDRIAVKVYEEIDDFVRGRISWAEVIKSVAESIAVDIRVRSLQAITAGLPAETATKQNAGAFDEDIFTDMLFTVEEKTGMKPTIYGSPRALSKIDIDKESHTLREEKYRDYGFYGMFKGFEVQEIPSRAVGEDNANTLFIIPEGEGEYAKPLKVYIDNANNTVYDITDGSRRPDEQIEYFMAQRFGAIFFKPIYYGVFKVE